jgi:hypothetical protein
LENGKLKVIGIVWRNEHDRPEDDRDRYQNNKADKALLYHD